jgi:membrane dipeptidase
VKKVEQLTKKEEERALQLHKKVIFINGCEPTSLHCFDRNSWQKIIESGMTAANKTIVSHEIRNEKYDRLGPNHEAILRKISDYYRFLNEHSDKTMLITKPGDIEEAKKGGKFGIIMGLQDAAPIGDNVSVLTALYKLEIRIIQLSYSVRNKLADGCGEKSDAGLSMLGVRAIEEMNRLGIIVDLSHVGHRSTMEAIELSRDPVLFTHANAYSIYPVARNKKDEAIEAMARKGGVIGCMGYAPAVKGVDVPTVEDYLDHIDYIAKLVGVDHVGIGIDFPWHHATPEWNEFMGQTYASAYPVSKAQIQLRGLTAKGLDSPELFPNITKGLVARGYSDQEIEKILGGNFMRVFKAVWRS